MRSGAFFFVFSTARYAVLYPCNLFDYLANKDTLPTFCRLDYVLLHHWLSRPQNEALIPLQDLILRSCFENSIIPGYTPSFWWHERRNQGDKKSLWWKSRFFRSDSISTIYPKSRVCTKRHKRRCFQGFSGFFESFSQNAEKENCKFEHRKCSFVLRSCIHK